MPNVRNIILKKKIEDVVYDLLVKTSAAQVEYGEVNVQTQLDSLVADVDTAKEQLATLLGEGATGSIQEQIDTAVQAAVDAINDDTDPDSLAGKLAALTTTVAENLTAAKAYTDEKIGLSGTAYATVKDYVDAIEVELNASHAGAFHFKGTVDYVADLANVVDPVEGAVYQVMYSGTEGENSLNAEYAYNGTEWVELGSIFDLSAYYTSAQVVEAINNSATATLATAAEAAELDATTKANAAQAAAIEAAATDATTKADAAQAAAIEAAAADATTKANAAQAAAEATASAYTDGVAETINATVATKARFLVGTVVPEDLTEADIFAQIIE